jgi:hypothetical protein
VLEKDGEDQFNRSYEKIKKCYKVKKERNILNTKKEGKIIGWVTYCVGTFCYHVLLKER